MTKVLFATTAAALLGPFCFAAPGLRPVLVNPLSAHTFEGNVAVKTAHDRNEDGKPDRIYHFGRHYIERIEWDTDLDGTMDLRATYQKPAKGESNLIYHLSRTPDGEYGFAPSAVVMEYPTHQHFDPIYSAPEPHYEALVDEKWTSSFAIELPSPNVFQPAHGNKVVTSNKFVCKEGSAVSLTTQTSPKSEGEYRQTLFKDGKVIRSVKGGSPESISEEIEFLYDQEPRTVTRTDRDGDGEFDYEVTKNLLFTEPQPFPGYSNSAYHMTARKKIEGEWTGTFIDENRRYVNGLLTEVFAYNTKDVVERREYDDKGKLVWVYNDSNFDGEFDKRQKPDGTTHKRIDGKWVGDFSEDAAGPSQRGSITYRGGRLVGRENTNYKEGKKSSTQYPKPGVVISSTSGQFMNTGRVRKVYKTPILHPYRNQLLREEMDTDSDGEPELFVDFQALTISKIRPADWPK